MIGRTRQPDPGQSAVLVIEGKSWYVADLRAVLKDYADRGSAWVWLLGCDRCGQICTHVSACKCCHLPRGQRLYDLNGGHSRIQHMEDFARERERRPLVAH